MNIYHSLCGELLTAENFNKTLPEIPICTRSLIQLIPGCFLTIFLPIYVIYAVKHHKTKSNRITTHSFIFKWIFTVFAIISHVSISMHDIYLYNYDFKQFVEWPTIVYLAHATSIIAQSMNIARIVTNSILFLMHFGLLVASCISEPKYFEPIEGKCPEIWASFFSKITYHWLNGPLWLGVKRTITENDLWELPPNHQSYQLYQNFKKPWYKHLKLIFLNAKESESAELAVDIEPPTNIDQNSHTYATEATPLIRNKPKVKPKTVSLFTILFKNYGKMYLFMLSLKFVSDITLVLSPILQSYFIHFNEDDDVHLWKRYGIAFLFFPVTFIGSLALHYMFSVSTKLSVNIYSCMCSAIYDKSLKISNTVDKDVGKISNLMSIDAKDFQDTITYSWVFFSAPFQLIIASYMLWRTVGVSTFFGITVVFIALPINMVIMKKLRYHQTEIMGIRDERIKFISQVMDGIRILKLYSWEMAMGEKITAIRKRELYHLTWMNYLNAAITFVWNFAPNGIVLSIYIGYVFLNGTINPEVVFVTLTLINILKFPITMLPMIIAFGLRTVTSFKRLNSFFAIKERDATYIKDFNSEEYAVKINNGSFGWNKNNSVLKDLNISFKKGNVTAIVGKVASGKSTLIQSILGETLCNNGSIDIDGRISYCAQTAWLQNMSIRDNILFGSEYNSRRYKKIISACSLEPDFNALVDGDQTEIGEKGVNISGGQKQRIALARSIYSNDDIYIFDDILSAVDAHVGKHIFDNILSINGILKNKTRIFVTNGMSYLSDVDSIIVMGDNGKVACKGNISDLECEGSEFLEFNQRKVSDTETSHIPAVLVNKETLKEGDVKMSVYTNYFKEIGIFTLLSTLLCYIISNLFLIGSSIYLQIWTSDTNARANSIGAKMGWYSGMMGGQAIFLAIYAASIAMAFVKGSRGLHVRMLHAVLRSPVSFFNSTPTGRLINRFTKDMTAVDIVMPGQLKGFIGTLFGVIGSFFILVYSNYVILIVIIPLCIVYYTIQRLYIRTSRQLKRIESVTRSPIFTKFSETLNGILTIRAFKLQHEFINDLFKAINKNNIFYYCNNQMNRWLAIRLDLIGNSLLLTSCIFAVYFQLNSALCGLLITYCLTITGAMGWMVRMKSDLESNSVSIERIIEYMQLEDEGQYYHNHEEMNLRNWPSMGKIVFQNYTMSYRPDLPVALNNVSITINPNEKIGIVGRTGSGKTTLAMSLFRIDNPTSGSIIIDDVDISIIGLHELRYSISIIPQDPFVFSLSIRENLDPNFVFTDQDIWEALGHCHLKQYIESLEEGLNYNCGENGSNFSVGQRQLLCLGRALLRKCKIIVLDEATASIDPMTDTLIQKAIKENFNNCTIITIAHRINTILDYDRILVMDSGKVAEYDTVQNLRHKKGIFFNLLKDANLD
ncbi:hypothetical protein A3Q56_03641 [Intoshia linei]|uniref:Multidrug resistance-associated protein 1 n=1 Tax=Intoshia linei TaxID=1819745 RepID=A0A177B5B9_9BILA|nr:hypothetical protein A3Q56_03641 [Intoshia linei]